jgi:hypothetical protein
LKLHREIAEAGMAAPCDASFYFLAVTFFRLTIGVLMFKLPVEFDKDTSDSRYVIAADPVITGAVTMTIRELVNAVECELKD